MKLVRDAHWELLRDDDLLYTVRIRHVGGFKVKRGRGQRRNRRLAHGPVEGLRYGFGVFNCFPLAPGYNGR